VVSYVERRDWGEPKPGRAAGVGLTGAAAQTRETWARRISDIDELPEPYRSPVRAELAGAPFPYAVLCPAFPQHSARTNESLILAIDDRITVFGRRSRDVAIAAFPRDELYAIEIGDVLLDGWLTLRGRAADLTRRSATLRFNTVTLEHLLPFVDACRPSVDTSAAPDTGTPAALKALSRREFKFYNLACSLRRDGDPLVDLLFQPAIRAPFGRLPLRIFSREIAPAHLVLVSSTELIVAADIDGHGQRDDRYGHVRRHVPLRHLVGARVDARPDGMLVARFDLPLGDAIEVVFERGADVDGLLSELRRAAA
jgi:hypothetical protein